MITCPKCGAKFEQEKGLALEKPTPRLVVRQPATHNKDNTGTLDSQGRVSKEVLIDGTLDKKALEYMQKHHFASIKGGYSIVVNMALTYFFEALEAKGETA